MVEEEESLRPNMCALAVLSCRPNSHPFQERHVSLHEPVKIGRSVARARPLESNGVFDCKVLSRHHAILWYEADKFYIQDTKSSNGTFINNQRLCKSGEESPVREIFSGDLIQLGVEVVENNRRGEKITHGCIIATITLYHPDGREAKPLPFLDAPNQPGIKIETQDLYLLAQYLQEALHREKMLEQKLSSLQQLVLTTQEAAEGGWQALIDEDKLLSRLEMLETQLHVYSKNHAEDTLRQELMALQEDKINYETTAKESLRRVLQEKLDAVTKLSDLERSLTSAEDECSHVKEMCESSQEELRQLAIKYQDQLKEVQDLQDKLQEAEKRHAEEIQRTEKEKEELQEKLEEMLIQETSLSNKIESLQVDNDFAREQLAAMKAKLESLKETNQKEEKALELGLEGFSSGDIIPLGDKDSAPENLEEKLKELQTQIEVYKIKLENSDKKLKESSDNIEQLQKELEMAQFDSVQYIAKIASLEEKVRLSHVHMNEMMENALDGLKLQLKESQKQSDSSEDLICSLEGHIWQIEKRLMQQAAIDPLTAPLPGKTVSGDNMDDTLYESDQDSTATITVTTVNGCEVDSLPIQDSNLLVPVSSTTSSMSDSGSYTDDENVTESREAQRKVEVEIQKYKDEYTETSLQLQKSTLELEKLKEQYFEVQQTAKERGDLVSDLQEQLRKAESDTKEVKQQILELRGDLELERTMHQKTSADLEETKGQLQEAQQAAKQSHNEAEQLRNRTKLLQEELELERRERQSSQRLSHGDSSHSGRTNRSKAEFLALKEECSNLRKRIQAIEAEMKMSRKENLQLSSEYNKLQESYKQLEALKEKLTSSEVATRQNLTDAQKSRQEGKETSKTPLSPVSASAAAKMSHSVTGRKVPSAGKQAQSKNTGDELAQLRAQCQQYSQQVCTLRSQIETMETDYRQIALRSKKLSFMSSVPLLVLLFAVLLAIYPFLEQITATTS
ncbi:uncharacterized protein LOC143284650 isoform X2 [Babylonia areolata]|uniref:uncharacterized protein LOC143284650 isoform X2 n=1 Tax=Babylonia areolata TaxID=304850 RepID=UPI003FCF7717